MYSSATNPQTTPAIPHSLSELPDTLAIWWSNLSTQTTGAFSRMGTKDYIRLTIFIGGYMLLRPWIVALGNKVQQKNWEKESQRANTEQEEAALRLRGGKVTDARGQEVNLPGEEVGEEDEDAPGAWGGKARKRQRAFLKRAMEAEEMRLEAEGSDKDIEDLLED